MLSYVYMKILESQAERYDRGIALLSLGVADRVAAKLVGESVRPGDTVLDVGCGTGRLSLLAAARGALVQGFDLSGSMLEVARTRAKEAQLGSRICFQEMGISGMATYDAASFDVVTCSLVLSEMTTDEQVYVLSQSRRVLRAGGRLLVVDEIRPQAALMRLAREIVRVPLAVITWLLTQTSTRAVENLSGMLTGAGFHVLTMQTYSLGSLVALAADVPESA